jgi:hypothetical protein
MFGERGVEPARTRTGINHQHLFILTRILSSTPRLWIWGLSVLSVLSVCDFTAGPNSFGVKVQVNSITVILVALIWLPAVLNVFALGGARVKVPAGELETLGLLDFMRSVESSDPLAPHEPVDARLHDLEVRYETLREVLPHGHQRTVMLEAIMLQARALVQSAEESGELDRRMADFESADEGSRAVTLGLLQATTATSVTMVECVVDAIVSARSAFEQYHGLRAAQLLNPRVSPLLQSRLTHAVRRAADSGTMSDTGYRKALVRQILEPTR